MRPLVSVIVIVKNGELYLRSAMESIMKQDYDPKEIIVIDGQSSDRTAEVARSFPVRFLVQDQPGIAAAYNLGIDESCGEYVSFLSHDDVWSPNKLSRQLSYMFQNPEMEYTITRGKYFLQAGSTIPAKFKAEMLQGDHVIYGMESLVARRSLFDRVGKFNPEFPVGEDMDWFFRVKDLGISMGIVPEVLLHKRVHGSSATMTEKNVNKIFVRLLKQSLERKKSL